jgi:hypothetical protein
MIGLADNMIRTAAILLALVWLGARVEAKTYYVAPDGNDTNPGSLQAPLQTIARAASASEATT